MEFQFHEKKPHFREIVIFRAKVQPKKTSRNQINQFTSEKCFSTISMKVKILISENTPKEFRENDLFHFTSFLARAFLKFLAGNLMQFQFHEKNIF